MARRIVFLMFLAGVMKLTHVSSVFLDLHRSTRGVIQGACPEQIVKADFDYSKFEGAWYLIQSEVPNDMGVTCTAAAYIHDAQHKMRNTSYVATDKNGEKILVREPEKVTQDLTTPGKLQLHPQKVTETYTVILGGQEVTIGPDSHVSDVPVDNWILDTDYSDYAIVWGCFSLPMSHHTASLAWIIPTRW